MFGSAACADTAAFTSGAISIATISPSDALVAYADGTLALFTAQAEARGAAAGLTEHPLPRASPAPASSGLRHFAAAATQGGALFAAAHGPLGGITWGALERGGAWAGGGPSALHVAREAPLPPPAGAKHAGATSLHIDPVNERLVYGSADGVVRRRALRTGAEEARSLAAGSGPCCHFVSSLAYSPDVVMAAG